MFLGESVNMFYHGRQQPSREERVWEPLAVGAGSLFANLPRLLKSKKYKTANLINNVSVLRYLYRLYIHNAIIECVDII